MGPHTPDGASVAALLAAVPGHLAPLAGPWPGTPRQARVPLGHSTVRPTIENAAPIQASIGLSPDLLN
ncbi:MAG: hypothetical protein EAY75_01670 [Bacteroidetes bacterium]|nr:MAG: hypothetical protein EAY75_01670 [Bacteroidota bacterium]